MNELQKNDIPNIKIKEIRVNYDNENHIITTTNYSLAYLIKKNLVN